MNCPICHTLIDPSEGCPRCSSPGKRATFVATLGALCFGVFALLIGGYLAYESMTAPVPLRIDCASRPLIAR